ncbi:unnamed protein product [Caenorhabditis brenneri]
MPVNCVVNSENLPQSSHTSNKLIEYYTHVLACRFKITWTPSDIRKLRNPQQNVQSSSEDVNSIKRLLMSPHVFEQFSTMRNAS